MCFYRFWSSLCQILGPALLAISALAAPPPEPESLEAALRDLGHPDFARREAATKHLWQYAASAREQLATAQASTDPEVRLRAERILEAFQMGILPDTPRVVVQQIYEFHDGSLPQKQAIIAQLVAADNLNTAFRLLRSLENSTLRNELAQIIATQVRAKLLPHLLNREWDQAEQILKKAALGDLGMRDYAAFVFLTDRLDAALASSGSTDSDLQLRVWLLRSAGRLDEAIALAKDDEALSRELRASNGDALAYCRAELARPNLIPSQRLRALAFQARLTGDAPGFDQAIKELLDLAENEENTYSRRFAVDSLLLNDVVDPVLPFLPKLLQQTAYDIQSYRGLYGDALKRLGIEQERPPYEPWVEERCKLITLKQQGTALQEIVDLAQRIHDMGEKREAVRMLEAAFEAAGNDLEKRRTLVTEEIRLGAQQLAEKHLRVLSASGTRIDQLRALLPFKQDLILQWHEFLLDGTERPADRLEALIAAWKLIDASEDAPGAEADSEPIALLDAAHAVSRTLDAKNRRDYLRNLYLTASIHHDSERATRYLEEIAQLAGDTTWYYVLGNTHMENQEWQRAAQAFDKAWQMHSAEVKASILGASTTVSSNRPQDSRGRLQPSYLYLAGAAHRKSGDREKGDKLIEQARLLCLGDLAARYSLATAMNKNGDEDLAREEWTLIARLSQLEENVGTWAFYHLAAALSKTDPERAIALQERVIVARHSLDVSMDAQFTFDIRLRSLVHQWQAKAHVLAGKPDAALQSLERYWQLTPGNASIGEELLPLLEQAGKTEEAKDYYERTRALAEEACRLFPDSAMAHNNLAWLDARSRRNLDQALAHAETAVRLKPRTAAYLDTLAEVHFTLGDREKALELSDQAVKLTPFDKELLGQRARFENAPLPAKRPPAD